jgi:hypothetical protein
LDTSYPAPTSSSVMFMNFSRRKYRPFAGAA